MWFVIKFFIGIPRVKKPYLLNRQLSTEVSGENVYKREEKYEISFTGFADTS